MNNIDLLDYEGFVEKRMSTKGDILYIPKLNEAKINEANDLFPDFPVNKRLRYNQALMIKAIQNGMIINIIYKSDDDKFRSGRERVLIPLVLGINRNTKNELLRAFHLEGQSVSVNKKNHTPYKSTEKVWRLFKTKNIKFMLFTGNFYRLPPKGYRQNDRVMTFKTIMRADFNQIRKNQEALIKSGKIESEERITVTQKEKYTTTNIKIKNSETVLNLQAPWENEFLEKFKKDASNVKITILKTIFSNEYIAVLGALGEPNKTVKVYEGNKLIGSYKTITSFTGDKFKENKKVKGISEFDLYIFEKKT